MNLMDLDEAILGTYTKGAEIFQEWTGKDVSALERAVNNISQAAGAVTAGIGSYALTKGHIYYSAGILEGGANFYYASQRKNEPELAEGIDSSPREPIICMYNMLGTTIFGALALSNSYLGTPIGTTVLSSMFISSLLDVSARYLKRVDIDPPSGKTVPQKLMEKLSYGVKPINNPV